MKILFQLGKKPNAIDHKTKIGYKLLSLIIKMKFAYLFAIAVRAQGDGTPHDPEAMAYCQGKL